MTSELALCVEEAQVENLRGYSNCTMHLARQKTVLVGPNNSGKTSLLKMVDWLLNHAPIDVLDGSQPPDSDLIEFLLPARKTRNRARRFTLWVRVPDGRSHRRYQCVDGLAQLRVNLRQTPDWKLYLALGAPTRGESAESSWKALELLERLRNDSTFVYVPSFRDGNSPRFRGTLVDAFRSRLAERALHNTRAGAPSEYRQAARTLRELRKLSEELVSPLWDDMSIHIPPGIARSAKISLDTGPADLVEWLTEHLNLRISTGPHDENAVGITDLGSGLQSLLDFAVHRSEEVDDNLHCTLVIEEPESFLHPAAQRTLARSLLDDHSVNRVVITTHSPIILEEASYSDVVLCLAQRFFAPTDLGDEAREEINAALLTGFGAEMMFARSVLLVEGESDRQFFERIRRRLARHDDSGRSDELFVVPVGGKLRFAPWMRLLDSYTDRGEQPIKWLVAADGDAAAQVRQAFIDASITVSADFVRSVATAGAERENGIELWRKSLRRVNDVSRATHVPVSILPVDLEDAALSSASQQTIDVLARKLGIQPCTRNEMLAYLGSKGAADGDNGVKHPWIRGYIAGILQPGEIGEGVRGIVMRWLEGVMTRREAFALFRKIAD